MRLHSNAKTTHVTRALIHNAVGSLRCIAKGFGVSVCTVRRWRGRASFEDKSSRPRSLKTSINDKCAGQLIELRRQGCSLDDIFEQVMDYMPLTRSSLYRLLKRNGLNRLAPRKKEPTKRFKEYEPGFIHIDCFHMPRMNGMRSYCFVAVDRATKRTHTAWFERKTQEVGATFLRSCLEAFEFKVAIVLTDNGTEFTNKAYAGPHGKASTIHAFDKVCKEFGIKHRLTKFRTPKTNGLVERYNQIIKRATLWSKTYLDITEAVQDILCWNVTNNLKRKRSLNYKSPLQKSLEWFTIRPELFHREPILNAA